MNYYQALKLADTGLYHYTCTNGNHSYAVGYCASGCPGHATPEEAFEHYRQYILDTRVNYDGLDQNTQRKCAVCGEWTQHFALVESRRYPLCDAHRNREELDKLVIQGNVISSW
jgi:ferredoxin